MVEMHPHGGSEFRNAILSDQEVALLVGKMAAQAWQKDWGIDGAYAQTESLPKDSVPNIVRVSISKQGELSDNGKEDYSGGYNMYLAYGNSLEDQPFAERTVGFDTGLLQIIPKSGDEVVTMAAVRVYNPDDANAPSSYAADEETTRAGEKLKEAVEKDIIAGLHGGSDHTEF